MTRRARLCAALFVVSACATTPPPSPPAPYEPITIEHGRVVDAVLVRRPSAAPAGALVGGMFGLLASGHSPAEKLIGLMFGAAAGGALTAAAEGPLEGWTYTVQLEGARMVSVLTDQPGLRPGDCVAVETGRFVNLRRVSGALCERAPAPDGGEEPAFAAREQESAAQCHAAKEELLRARTREEVDVAVRKVRVLCDT